MPNIPITDIDTDHSVQVRAGINQTTVEEYAEHLKSKRPPLPPIVLFGPNPSGKYYLAEGWHRLAAHKKAGLDAIPATIQTGDWKQALEHALGSNCEHGLRRTGADKRRAVELALKHWSDWSDTMIAEKCGVSRPLVFEVRRNVHPVNGLQPAGPRQVRGKDGKIYPVPAVSPSKKPSPPTEPPTIGTEDEKSTQRLENNGKPSPTSGNTPAASFQRSEERDAFPPPPERPAPKPPPLPIDQRGRTVPPHLVQLWERRQEVERLTSLLKEIEDELEQARADLDPLWCGAGQGQTPINFSTARAHLKQARATIKEALPWAVCPMCQGTGCRCCSGNGLTSKFRYDTIIPARYKEAW
jgi:hypothetical protein